MTEPHTARLAGGYATLWNLLFVPAPYIVGVMAILILPQLDDPELAIFQVAQKLLPPAVTGIVMAAIMAAIMSTADSLLLQTGSVASRDIYERFWNRKATDRQMVLVSRGLILAIGVIGYVVAIFQPRTVFDIVVFATSVLGSAFAPAFFCAVWWRKANTPGAIASIIAGTMTSVGWEIAQLAQTTTVHPMAAGLLASSIAILVVSLLTARIAPVAPHILAAMDEAARVGRIPASMRGTSDVALSPKPERLHAPSSRSAGDGGPSGR
jgi:sodium/proline symporter